MDIFRHDTNVEKHPAGSTLLERGTPGDRMYVVKDGEVAILVGDQVLERVGPGGFFGEMALVDHAPRSATARALTDVAVVPIDEKHFVRLIQETPGFALSVMRGMAKRLREMDDHA